MDKAIDTAVASDSVNGVAAVKATIQAKEDSTAPVAVVLEPTEDAVSHEVTGPATPVPTIKPVAVADHTVDLSEPQKTVVRHNKPRHLHLTAKQSNEDLQCLMKSSSGCSTGTRCAARCRESGASC